VGRVLRRRGARRALAAGVVAGLAALVGCGPSGAALQALPPEIQATAAVYDAPTGTVPASAMQQIAELQQIVSTIRQSHAVDVASQALAKLHDRVQEGGLPTDPTTTLAKNHPVIAGSITVTRICRGWNDAVTTPDTTNGTIQLIAQFDRSTLQRAILGTATRCHERIDLPGGGTAHVFLDGAITLYIEGPLLPDASRDTYLMAFDGTIGTEASTVDAAFDFRVAPPQLEVRIAVADGDIIGSVGATEASLRGANGTFGCSFDTFQCGPL
jgi:hypothetical protein